MLAQPSEAEDIVQETFLGLLRSIPNYDRARSLETYLFAILRHKLSDHFRKQGRGQRQSLEQLDLDDASPAEVDPTSRHSATSAAQARVATRRRNGKKHGTDVRRRPR